MQAHHKRPQHEIERDYKRCQAFMIGNTTMTSINDLANALNLTPAQVKVSYSNHPVSYRRLIEQLNINNQRVKEAARIAPVDIPHTSEKKVKVAQNANIDNSLPACSGYVLDASVTDCPGIITNLERICYVNGIITLTSVTIRELDNLKKGIDRAAHDARSIIRMALSDPTHFKCVAIDENGEPDDCIIKYCVANKEKVTLLTADNAMTLKARMYGVSVYHFEHKEHALKTEFASTPVPAPAPTCSTRSVASIGSQLKTLYGTSAIDGKLYLLQLQRPGRSIRVISDGIEYDKGPCELKRGDDVYVIIKFPHYVSFSHLRLTNLNPKNNSVSVFSKRIYGKDDIDNLHCAGYKSFVRDFVKREKLF